MLCIFVVLKVINETKTNIMKAVFQNKNLVNYTGQVLVDKYGFPKIYTSIKVANRTAEKLGATVVKNIKRYIITL